jgi:NitT/TauT family transport system permease protein
MQLSQVQLETDQVLSWTLMAILLTAVFDLLFDGLVWSLGKLKKHVDARSALCDSNP